METLGRAGFTSRGPRPHRALAALLLAAVGGCAIVPGELNLSPLYRHRLDADGSVLELDVLWPIVHYETTADGGTDFRIRPIYRRLTEPEAEDSDMSPADGTPDPGIEAVEHQFLWPLGRVRDDRLQSMARLWPLFWHRRRASDDEGLADVDWYALFPLIWGGSREDGAENYFGVFPLFGSFPDFLTYERFRFVLFPLYLGLEKQGWTSHQLLWPLIGWADRTTGEKWRRFIPFFSYVDHRRYRRWSILWPFFHWSRERLDTDDPVDRWFFWPLFGCLGSDSGATWGWTFLWPFFQYLRIEDRLTKIDVLWPFFRYYVDRSESTPRWQWWVWPLVARTITDRQWAWSFLWPLIWIREYHDPEGTQKMRIVLPIWTWVFRERDDGTTDEYAKLWPLFHHEHDHDGRGDWSTLSPLPLRAGNMYGVAEAYDWLWTLAKGTTRGPDDSAVQLTAHLYTSRTRGPVVQSSVPFLFNYEADGESEVLRLFQLIPIPLGGAAHESDEEAGAR